jgi:hypothetical protein
MLACLVLDGGALLFGGDFLVDVVAGAAVASACSFRILMLSGTVSSLGSGGS